MRDIKNHMAGVTGRYREHVCLALHKTFNFQQNHKTLNGSCNGNATGFDHWRHHNASSTCPTLSHQQTANTTIPTSIVACERFSFQRSVNRVSFSSPHNTPSTFSCNVDIFLSPQFNLHSLSSFSIQAYILILDFPFYSFRVLICATIHIAIFSYHYITVFSFFGVDFAAFCFQATSVESARRCKRV